MNPIKVVPFNKKRDDMNNSTLIKASISLLFFVFLNQAAVASDSIFGLSLGDNEEKMREFISSKLKNNIVSSTDSKDDKFYESQSCGKLKSNYINIKLKENFLKELNPLLKDPTEFSLGMRYEVEKGLYNIDYNVYLKPKSREQCIDNISILEAFTKARDKRLICDNDNPSYIYEGDEIKEKEIKCKAGNSDVILRSVFTTILERCVYSINLLNEKIQNEITDQASRLYNEKIGNKIKEKKAKTEKEFKICFKPVAIWDDQTLFYTSNFQTPYDFKVSCMKKNTKVYTCNWKNASENGLKNINDFSGNYDYNHGSYIEYSLQNLDTISKDYKIAAFNRKLSWPLGCNEKIKKDEYTGYITNMSLSEKWILHGEECDF